LVEGAKWRAERAEESQATLIAFLLQPWSDKPLTPKVILDAMHGTTATDFEQLAGFTDPGEAIEAMVKKQQARRAAST